MPIKWKLFGIANYIILLIHAFLLLGAMRFTTEVAAESQDMAGFMPFMVSLFIVILNAVFNLYIFHKHLPDNPVSRRVKTPYLISAILFAIALMIISIPLIRDSFDELSFSSDKSFGFFLLTIFCLVLLIGLFVLINQFVVLKFIEKNATEDIEE